MRVLMAGNNILSCNILEWLIQSKEEVVGIVSEKKDFLNRDVGWEKPFVDTAKRISREYGIPLFTGNINRIQQDMEALNLDLIEFSRYSWRIRNPILNIPTIGCTNLHYGALPRYGGRHTVLLPILNGETEVGVTLHFMNKNFDEGPIIAQEMIDITGKKRRLSLPHKQIEVTGLTAFEIYQECNNLAFQMFREAYPKLKKAHEQGRRIDTRKQDLSKKLYNRTEALDLDQGRYIDLEASSDEQIARHARAFYYPPKNIIGLGRYHGKEIPLLLE